MARNSWIVPGTFFAGFGAGCVLFLLLKAGDGTVGHEWLLCLAAAFFAAGLAGAVCLLTASQQVPMPALLIDVLPSSDMPGSYKNQKTDQLILTADETGTVFRTRCALRLENRGMLPASGVFLVFFFQREKTSHEAGQGGLVVDYNREKQSHAQCRQCDVEVRDGYPVGYTILLTEDLTVYPDANDRPIVAELELIVKNALFGGSYDLHYRVQSRQGNRFAAAYDRKSARTKDSIYALSLIPSPAKKNPG